MKEINKTAQDLKIEMEAIETTRIEATLEMQSLGKRTIIIGPTTTTQYKTWKRESQV